MPLYCAAFNCKNRNRSCESEISFHRFPLKNLKLLSEWNRNIRRKGWKPTKHSRLCSSHFNPEDYTNKPGVKRKFLIDDAVPTIFSFPATFSQPSKKRRPLIRAAFNVSNEPCETPEQESMDDEDDPNSTYVKKTFRFYVEQKNWSKLRMSDIIVHKFLSYFSDLGKSKLCKTGFDHSINTDINEDMHITQLIRLITIKYLNVRLHDHAKSKSLD